MPTSNRSRRQPAFAAILMAATTLGWCAAPAFADDALADMAHAAPIDVGHPAAQSLPGFGDLVAKVSPAVVTISTTLRPDAGDQTTDFSGDAPGGSQTMPPEFRRFFGTPDAPQQQQTVHALGSGFIIDAQGHVVTNNHVVQNATDIEVTLADGRELKAKVVGTDPKTDLAVLQVESAQPLPHLALGNSDATRIGDWVVAVGNPFGLGGTVTAGILSARGRQIGQGPYDDFLQVDAPINRGNSGGPLFAQDGTVIGVNTAIYSPTGGSVGIGFAIPSEIVKQVVSQLETNGKVERGWLGVSAQALSPTMTTALHMADNKGALVAEIEPNSPAAAAGLKAGDVITHLGSQPVTGPGDLARIVADTKAGTGETITVHRNGSDTSLQVTIAALRDGNGARQADADHGAKLGLALAPLDEQARNQLNLPAGQTGVVISDVRPDSPAEQAGLQSGDVLDMVGDQKVTSPQQAVTALRAATSGSGSAVAVRVLRDGRQLFVALAAGQPSQG
jgi:serine protease Do